jgi:hypothetical protein
LRQDIDYLTAGGSVPEFLVDPVGNVQELLMRSGLNNAPAMKNEDNVRVPEKKWPQNLSKHSILMKAFYEI